MIRITTEETVSEVTIILEGRLTKANVSEVVSAWTAALEKRGTRRCVVDLRNAIFIDPCAEKALLDMQGEGARFIACGVSTTYRLQRLGIKCGGPSQEKAVGIPE